MRFPVAQDLKQPIGYQAQYDLDQGYLPLSDDAILTDLKGSLSLLRTDRGLLVSVVATATVRETCSRCLADIEYPLRFDFQEEYFPTVDVFSGSPLSIATDDDNFLIGPDFLLDLDEALRQYKVMAELAKPLCRPDCRGLCPHCGHNLNLGPCSCPQETDKGWDALPGLFEALKEGEGS